MNTQNEKLETTFSGIGWGVFFVMVGMLFLAQNQGWMEGGWWEFFAIGLGGILVAGFLLRYFTGSSSHHKAFGGLIVGLALIYVGLAFLNGIGDWWPLALIPIGIDYIVKAFGGARTESETSPIHNNPSISN
jgi:hypothetical protein